MRPKPVRSKSDLGDSTLLPRRSRPSNRDNSIKHAQGVIASRRRGSVLLLMIFILPMLFILAAFAINAASLELRRTELYIATDVAARAGGRELTMSKSTAAAQVRAKQIALLNDVGNAPLTLDNTDIEFGFATRAGVARYDFTAGVSNPNSLRVTAKRKTGSPDGPLTLPFPGFLGSDTVNTQQVAISTQVQVDIALVIDRSGSMAYASDEKAVYPNVPVNAPAGWTFGDPAPPKSRWLDVVAAFGVLKTELSNSPADELVALASYNNQASIDQLLTADYTALETALDVYTQSLGVGATNIGGGIIAGVDAMVASPAARNGAIKVVVVLTDGIHNTGTDPVWAAKQASAEGAMIYSVTFSNEADQYRMRQVAANGRGNHFHADSGDELKLVFAEIAKQLPALLTK